jgi:hypothetical protein
LACFEVSPGAQVRRRLHLDLGVSGGRAVPIETRRRSALRALCWHAPQFADLMIIGNVTDVPGTR